MGDRTVGDGTEGGGLVISGAGSTAVATDDLLASAQRLHRLATEASSIGFQLAHLDRSISLGWLQSTSAPPSAARAELAIDQVRLLAGELECAAKVLDGALNVVADGYGFAEHFIQGMGVGLSGSMGSLLGSIVPAAILGAPLVVAAGGALGAAALHGAFAAPGGSVPPATSDGGNRRHENNELLTNPLTVSLIRNAVMSIDDAALAASGLPLPVAGLVSSALGTGGLAFGAGAIARAGSAAGLLTETPVRLAATAAGDATSAPVGYREHLARIPDPDTSGGAQVVIEKYTATGQPDRFAVYIAGTVTFSPEATSEPWDMTSNISNAAGDGGGSVAAVAQAMALAGIDESSPVQLTGYSQGGGAAARLAASGDYNVQGLLSFGGPTGQIQIPQGFPAVIVEHSDDLVPALGGVQSNQHAVIVERQVFAGRDIPTDYAVPAHHREYYTETATLMDAARSEQVAGSIASLDAFSAGSTGMTSTAYTLERVSGPSDSR